MSVRPVIAVLAILCSSACYSIKPPLAPERVVREPFMSQPQVENSVLGRPEWGLALSGGGIRSGTTVIGALKALYDQDVLNNVDVISTVSGGGYGGYWLFSREYRQPSRPTRKFGAGSFESQPFLEAICEIATTNNFVSYPQTLGRWILHQNPTESYANSILRTFGHANYDLPRSYTVGVKDKDTIEFHEMAELVRQKRIPNLIVNARVYRPKPKNGWMDGMYEFTPLHRGAASPGYLPWNDSSSYALLHAVAASGAAVAFPLDRTLPSEVAGVEGTKIQLSDGGHGENLGALALIRRRIPNIIIIDAEQDRNLKFEAYRNLRERLLSWGDTLEVPAINSLLANRSRQLRPDSGAYFGTIRSGNYKANLYYMKLSIPISLNEELMQSGAADERASTDRARILEALNKGPRLGSREAWDCRNLRNLSVDLRALAIHEIGLFVLDRDLNDRTLGSLRSTFPHQHTFELQYNIDETMAQVGIGYLLGEELGKLVRRMPAQN